MLLIRPFVNVKRGLVGKVEVPKTAKEYYRTPLEGFWLCFLFGVKAAADELKQELVTC